LIKEERVGARENTEEMKEERAEEHSPLVRGARFNIHLSYVRIFLFLMIPFR
jgi:hypothetical protein